MPSTVGPLGCNANQNKLPPRIKQFWRHDFRRVNRTDLSVYEWTKGSQCQPEHARLSVVVCGDVLKQKMLTDPLNQMHGV